MKVSKLATIMALAGMLPCGLAMAQSPVRQPSSVQQTAFAYGSYYDEGEGEASASPSDAPAAETPAPAPAADGGACATCDSGCTTCDSGCEAEAEEPWRLFNCQHLECHGISIRGWLDQSVTGNNWGTPWNGTVSFVDREGYQMNQLYLIGEKATDTGGDGWDLGGRVDLLYGTDQRFTMARGLELEQDLSGKWNSGPFYGLAMPQLYAEVAYNDLKVKFGHYYTIIGYEVVTAPDNFFISHAYTMQYGEPFTHTGFQATYQATDRLSVSGGLHRGWDNWEDDDNDKVSFLGGATLTSEDEKGSLAFGLTFGDEPTVNPAVPFADRWMYSIVYQRELNDNWKWVIQHDNGFQDAALDGGGNAEWYGVNNYLFYTINDYWTAGFRGEWFRDDDGFRVSAVGNINNRTVGPQNPAVGPFVGNFYELAWGLNYKPSSNWIVRGELRYDWFDGQSPPGGEPFDNGNEDHQFLYTADLIMLY